MDINGRYEDIGDVLAFLHTGQWFSWNNKERIYSNLVLTEKMGVDGEVVDNPHSLPTEKELTDALAKQQSDFDAQEYARSRAVEYPSIPEQLDEIYHNGINAWKAVIKVTKDKYPKG